MDDLIPAAPISPLRQRLIDDITMREFSRETQCNYSWLAEREADLLPVGYFHIVFLLPAAVADVAFQMVCVLLFRAASDTMTTIAADPGLW